MEKNKIIIVHDTFLYKGGGERLILMMAKILQSDIASGFFSSGSFDLRKEGFTGKMISVGTEYYKKGLRHIYLKYCFFTKTKFLQEYDMVIFSGDSISAVRNCTKNTKKVYYCHTPPRYIYDLHDFYCKKVPKLLLPFFKIACRVFKYFYEKDISHMDIILTNSKNTQARIKKYLGLDSEVVYPCVDIKKFQYSEDSGYFLSFARLSDAKRVDKIVEAFLKIPNKKLIVIYGKNDPQKEKILTQAKDAKNISCLSLEDNNELDRYIAECRATIYIPIQEDFGMSPVESMSAGKPVIGVNEGGLKESIIHKKTGYLLNSTFTINDIIEAVEYFDEKRSLSFREDCEKQAQKFSIESMSLALQNILYKKNEL